MDKCPNIELFGPLCNLCKVDTHQNKTQGGEEEQEEEQEGKEMRPGNSPPDTTHLSADMKALVAKVPTVLKDNLMNCNSF